MTVLGIALRSLAQRRLSTALTSLSVGLGIALVVLVFQVRDTSTKAFNDAARGYDVVLGGIHTSSLTTVLSTVFHADKPTDTLPASVLDAVKADKRVKFAVPTAVGDVVEGYRVVATTPEFFQAIEDADRRPLVESIRAPGRVFGGGAEFEAVVGGIVASRLRLDVGSKFHVSHGLEKHGNEHEQTWTVVGVMKPTGTPNDRIVLVTLGSYFLIPEHSGGAAAGHGGGMDDGHDDHDHDHGDEAAEPKVGAYSSIIVRLTSPLHRLQFVADMKARSDVQPALPPVEITRLLDIVKSVDEVFRIVAWLVLLVSGMAILVGLWNTMEGRRREIAILRALGARPAHVFSVVVLEAVVLCLLGGVVGLSLGHAGVVVAAPILLDMAGIRIAPSFGATDLWLLLALAGMGVVTGLLPAWRAFRTPVAENLHPVD